MPRANSKLAVEGGFEPGSLSALPGGRGAGGGTEALRRDALSWGWRGSGIAEHRVQGCLGATSLAFSVHPDLPQRETQYPLPRVWRAL